MGARTPQSEGTVPDWVRSAIEERIRLRTLDLPLLPDVAAEALRLCQSESDGARPLAEILHRDAGLAGNVLRVVNSPLYGGRSKITSLQQAVSRVGVQVIMEVVLSVTMHAVLFKVPGRWAACIGNPARLSLVTALYAKEVAGDCGHNPDTAFLTGLLHRIGLPVVLAILERLEKHHRLTLDLVEVEATVEAYRGELAGQLAGRWGLAEEIVLALQHQDDWHGLEHVPPGAPLVQFAAALAKVAVPEYREDPALLNDHPSLQALGVDKALVDDYLAMGEKLVGMANMIR